MRFLTERHSTFENDVSFEIKSQDFVPNNSFEKNILPESSSEKQIFSETLSERNISLEAFHKQNFLPKAFPEKNVLPKALPHQNIVVQECEKNSSHVEVLDAPIVSNLNSNEVGESVSVVASSSSSLMDLSSIDSRLMNVLQNFQNHGTVHINLNFSDVRK